MHTILHIGAGQASELEQWLATGAQQIVLVEPSPALAARLRQQTAEQPQIIVVEAAISTASTNNQLREYNLPEASSLRPADGLKALFPGLKTTAIHTVATMTPEQLLEQYCPEAGLSAMLVIQAPGEEHAIAQALINSDLLKHFDHLYLCANPEPYYQDSAAADITLNALEGYGYDITAEHKQDPDWPIWELQRNPLKDQVGQLQKQLRQQTEEFCAERDSLTAVIAGLEQKYQAVLQSLEQQQEVIKSKDTLLEQQQVEQRAKQVELEELWQALEAKDDKLVKQEKALEAKHAELEDAQQTLESTKSELTSSCEAKKQLAEQKNRLHQDVQGLRKERDDLKISHAALEQECQATKQQLDEKRKANEAALTEQLEQSKKQLATKQTRLKDLEAKVCELTRHNEVLEKKNQLMQQDLVKAESQLQLIKEFVLHE